MRVLLQKVSEASIDIDGAPGGQIGPGLVIFLGIGKESEKSDALWLIQKILKLRLFEHPENPSPKENLSLSDITGDLLIVSQFTLHASTKKGTQPSYHRAAIPDIAKPLYEFFIETMRTRHDGLIKTGKFGAHMDVSLKNEGPITILLDSKLKE